MIQDDAFGSLDKSQVQVDQVTILTRLHEASDTQKASPKTVASCSYTLSLLTIG